MGVDGMREPDGEPGIRIFVARRQLRVAGVIGMACFIPMSVAGIWLPFANPDGSFVHPGRAAMIGGGIFGVFAVLSAYVLLASGRMRITVLPTEVQITGAFRARAIRLADLVRARWRVFPAGGSLVLHAPAGHAVIEFASYDGGDELCALLRRTVPERIQEDYQRFEAAVLVRRPPVTVGANATLRFAAVSLALACAWYLSWDVEAVRMAVAIPLIACPAMAVVAALDLLRCPSRRAAVAAAIALLAVAVLLSAIWPTLRPFFA